MFDLIATAAVAAVAASVVFVVFRLLRRRPPRYLMPFAAGLAMLMFTLWNDYTWASRMIGALPSNVTVVDEIATPSPWMPWTYVFPRTNRVIAVGKAGTELHHASDRFVPVEVVLLERYQPSKLIPQVFDCEKAGRANVDLTHGLPDLDALASVTWIAVRRDSEMFEVVCDAH